MLEPICLTGQKNYLKSVPKDAGKLSLAIFGTFQLFIWNVPIDSLY
jgi:hypothetical protein